MHVVILLSHVDQLTDQHDWEGIVELEGCLIGQWLHDPCQYFQCPHHYQHCRPTQ